MNPAGLLVIRHGETAWSRTRRHTGRADIPLTEEGRRQAADLPRRLSDAGLRPSELGPTRVSPASRAQDTATLAGFTIDRIDPDLAEWDYGVAEDRTTDEIRTEHPDWNIWDAGPGALGDTGEHIDEVGARADRVIASVAGQDRPAVLVGHAHLLRILAARWLGLPPIAGRFFALDAAGWGLLGWERGSPQILRWNPPSDFPVV